MRRELRIAIANNAVGASRVSLPIAKRPSLMWILPHLYKISW